MSQIIFSHFFWSIVLKMKFGSKSVSFASLCFLVTPDNDTFAYWLHFIWNCHKFIKHWWNWKWKWQHYKYTLIVIIWFDCPMPKLTTNPTTMTTTKSADEPKIIIIFENRLSLLDKCSLKSCVTNVLTFFLL